MLSRIPQRWRLLLAFAAVYLIWGSTYLGVRAAVASIPPFLMMGSRFTVAGLILIAAARVQGAALPSAVEWRDGLLIGTLLFLINNGIIVWASQHLPSGVLSLLVAAVPMWFALLDWRINHQRPGPAASVGLGIGIIGLLLLISPDRLAGGSDIAPIASLLVVFGTLAWAGGSVYSRRAHLPSSPMMSTGIQLFTGGGLLVGLDLISGEFMRFDLASVTMTSVMAWVYLWSFGSIVAFSAYTYLLRHTTATRAATYAFVNPIVALLLGWALAGEPLTLRTLLAAFIIVGAVALIILSRGHMPVQKPPPALETPSLHR